MAKLTILIVGLLILPTRGVRYFGFAGYQANGTTLLTKAPGEAPDGLLFSCARIRHCNAISICDGHYTFSSMEQGIIQNVSCTLYLEELYTLEGSAYILIRSKHIWAEARALCLSLGGYLVEINNPEEQLLLETAMKSKGLGGKHLAGGRKQADGTFVWDSTGMTLVYSNWYPNQPDDGSYSAIKPLWGYKWVAVNSASLRKSICEFDLE